MYCRSCGKPNAEAQRFCTSCGLGLDPLSETSAVTPAASPVSHSNAPIHQPFWQSPLLYGLFLLMFGFFITAVGMKAFHNASFTYLGEVIAGLGALLIFCKGVLHIVLSLGAQVHAHANDSKGASRGGAIPSTHRPFLPAPGASVTENTTRQLDALIEPVMEPHRDRENTAPNTQPGLQH